MEPTKKIVFETKYYPDGNTVNIAELVSEEQGNLEDLNDSNKGLYLVKEIINNVVPTNESVNVVYSEPIKYIIGRMKSRLSDYKILMIVEHQDKQYYFSHNFSVRNMINIEEVKEFKFDRNRLVEKNEVDFFRDLENDEALKEIGSNLKEQLEKVRLNKNLNDNLVEKENNISRNKL